MNHRRRIRLWLLWAASAAGTGCALFFAARIAAGFPAGGKAQLALGLLAAAAGAGLAGAATLWTVNRRECARANRLARQARDSESRYRAFSEASGEMLIIHSEGKLLDANRAFERISGYSRDDSIGMSIFEFVPEDLRETTRARIATEDPGPFETQMLLRDGSVIDIEISAIHQEYMGRSARIVAARDITDRKRQEQTLRRREEFEQLIALISTQFLNLSLNEIDAGIREALKAVCEFAPADRGFIYVFRDDGRRVKNIFSWSAPGIEGPPDIPDGIEIHKLPAFFSQLAGNQIVHVPSVERMAGSRARNTLADRGIKSAISLPMVYGGQFIGFIGFSCQREEADWSEATIKLLRMSSQLFANALARRQAEEARREINARLDEANRQLQGYSANLEAMVRKRTTELEQERQKALEASRLKSEFLSMMTHELRTPLNSILGLAQVVLRKSSDSLPERQQENLRSILVSGKRLLGLINQLLDLSKIEAGRMEVEPEILPVRQLLAEAANSIRPLAQAKGLALRVRNRQPGEQIRTDRNKVIQILVNLLGNAVKFTDRGSIDLVAEQKMGGYSFSVIDTGIGIGGEDRDIIFAQFRQADASATRRHGGAGLGLAISRHLASLLGGTLTVESELGKGSAFSLWLPKDCQAETEGAGESESGQARNDAPPEREQ